MLSRLLSDLNMLNPLLLSCALLLVVGSKPFCGFVSLGGVYRAPLLCLIFKASRLSWQTVIALNCTAIGLDL